MYKPKEQNCRFSSLNELTITVNSIRFHQSISYIMRMRYVDTNQINDENDHINNAICMNYVHMVTYMLATYIHYIHMVLTKALSTFLETEWKTRHCSD